MQHVQQDEHGWDEWFDAAEEEQQEASETSNRGGIGRYIVFGLALEAIVLVVALASA